MEAVRLEDAAGEPSRSFAPGDTITIVVDHGPAGREISPVLGVVVKTADQSPVFGIDNRTVDGFRFRPTRAGGRLTCRLPDIPLAPGTYCLDVYLGDSFSSLDVVKDAVAFEVRNADVYGTGRLPSRNCGPILWRAEWTWTEAESSRTQTENTWSAPSVAGL